MLKRISLVSIFLTAWLHLSAQFNFNGNLEKIDKNGRPEGWAFSFDKERTYKVGLDSLIKRQGKYSVSITAQDGEADYGAINHFINQSFHGRTLTLVGSIKTQDVNDGFAALWLRVNGTEKKVIAYENMEKNGIKGSNDWKDYHIQLPYNEHEAVSINAGALLIGKGKIWIDSLRLYIDDELIEKSVIKAAPFFAGELDTAFSKSSGIDTILLTKRNSSYLNLLGQLWGFLKYHHPAIAKGNFNWDAELMRVLPDLLKCETNNEVSKLFEAWIDKLGPLPSCADCKPIGSVKDIAVTPDYGNIFKNPVFSTSLSQKLKYILANPSPTQKYHYYIGMNQQIGHPEFRHEKLYADMNYPDVGYRLLALYRYWNIIQYFFPSRNLIGEEWSGVLRKFIPEFVSAENDVEYAKAMCRIIASIHDSHAFGDSKALEKFKGLYRVPFHAKFIEGKLVVTGYYKQSDNAAAKFKVGDIIESINGVRVKSLVKKYLPFTSASNFDTKLRDVPGNYLLRNDDRNFDFGLLREGTRIKQSITGISADSLDTLTPDFYDEAQTKAYSLLSRDIGYIYSGRYQSSELSDIKKVFAKTKGMIIDMRSYPKDEIIHTLGNYIKPFASPFVRFTQGSIDHPGLFVYTDNLKSGDTGDNYKGKVVVIVNSYTQSNAEFVTMALQSSPNVTVIGSTTAGADGNISKINLPGGISTNISGIGVYYPDGTNAQRRGVKINHYVKPSIKGIKEGRDELLEKAEEIIKAMP